MPIFWATRYTHQINWFHIVNLLFTCTDSLTRLTTCLQASGNLTCLCHLAGTLTWSQVTLYQIGAPVPHGKRKFGGRNPQFAAMPRIAKLLWSFLDLHADDASLQGSSSFIISTISLIVRSLWFFPCNCCLLIVWVCYVYISTCQ